jgi:hypothetical protein
VGGHEALERILLRCKVFSVTTALPNMCICMSKQLPQVIRCLKKNSDCGSTIGQTSLGLERSADDKRTENARKGY